METITLSNIPFGLFNEYTHRLTFPPVKISQYFSFVKTCLGSQHSFELDHMILSTPLQYGIRFFQHPLPTKPSPSLTVGIPSHISGWDLMGLPSSLCPTFNRALREALSPGCASDDKGMKKNHPYLATHLFGLGVSATFRRFLITRFITPSLSFPIGSLASPQPTFVAKC